MKSVQIVKPLDSEGISEAIKAITDFLESGGCVSKDVVRVTLCVEESLLTIRDRLGDSETFQVRCAHFLHTNTVTVTVSGRNVMDSFVSDDSFEIPMNRILSDASIRPEYSYESGMNKIKLELNVQTRLSIGQKSILSLVIGAGLGGLATLLPGTVGADIGAKILSPIFSTFIQVVSALAALMVFLSVAQSIYLIGDKDSFRKIGGKFFRNTLGKMLLLSAVCTLACRLVFHPGTGGSAQTDFYQIFDMILQIVPTSIVNPFLSGDILQILFLSVCLGVTLLLLGNRVPLAKQFIDQCCDIVNHAMEYVLRLMPYSIGMSVFTLITDSSLSSLGGIVKLMAIFILFIVITVLFSMFFTCLRWKRNLFCFIKDMMPIVILSFSTASSAAVMPLSMEICEKKLGIDKKLITFGVPTGTAMFKLGSVIYRVVVAFGLAEIFGVAITPFWLINCILISFCLSIAVPAVPGGGLTVLALLLAQLGIPDEALTIIIACDFITDRFATVCNCHCCVSELVNIAEELKMASNGISPDA